ncbi:MAG: UDP-N-acetylmuramoyl-tripeptide--D-alanyl-D-alanine ligase [Spirochaetaceae bacterium]|nr:UDP-N-acetylmuramoyl-tripeptide--D-alanyl-D-alanine ligase [Spirochaetaceae bacterium]
MGFSDYKYGIFSVAHFSNAVVIKQSSLKILSISIDSRNVSPLGLFVALKGFNVDGHKFILNAIEAGASAIMIDEPHAREVFSMTNNKNIGILVVKDTLLGLQALARNYVAQFPKINYTAITGSCGKSTTKQALAALLTTEGTTVFTPGNLNSEIGIALSLLNIDSSTEFGVFEMGIDKIGEMDKHLSMIKPNQALITNIGFSHLESFGSRKIIAKEKGKIFHPDLEQGFISKNCTYKSLIQRRVTTKLVNYSIDNISYISRGLLGYDIKIDNEQIRVPLIGEHQIEDIAGAISVARYIGLSNKQIVEGLRLFKPMVGRGSITDGRITVIEDFYNASLNSTSSMLGYLEKLFWKGSKKVILGDMRELGKESKWAHKLVAKSIYQSGLQSSFLFGEEMYSAYKYLKAENYKKNVFYSDNFEEIRDAVDKDLRDGDLFLLKGSRAMAVERLIPTLRGVM